MMTVPLGAEALYEARAPETLVFTTLHSNGTIVSKYNIVVQLLRYN